MEHLNSQWKLRMKTFLHNRKSRLTALILAGLAVAGVIRGFNSEEARPSFGLVGMLAGSETMRINVSNVRPIQGSSCQAALTFTGTDGAVLQSTMVTIAPGQSYSYDLELQSATGAPERNEVLPSVKATGCLVASSVEVINNASSLTDAYVTHASGGINHNENLVRDPDSE
jgi:hypothetical protein